VYVEKQQALTSKPPGSQYDHRLVGGGERRQNRPTRTTDPSEAKPANEVTTDFGQPISPATGNQDRASSACEPYRELIERGLGRGRNAMAIWQDLVSDHGFPHGYQTVKRFVRKLRGSESPQAVGIILTAAGEEAQVDYGSGPMARDAQSGKYRRTPSSNCLILYEIVC
jgi:hypothetical protein